MRILLAFAVVLLAFGNAAYADAPLGFDRLRGEWAGSGTFQGGPSKVAADFQPLFGGKYWRLQIRTDFTAPDGSPASFHGEGTYVVGAQPMWGSWVDDTGAPTALQPAFEDNTLVVRWGRPGEAPTGRSVTTLNADGTLTIEDFVESAGGELRSFARSELQRAP